MPRCWRRRRIFAPTAAAVLLTGWRPRGGGVISRLPEESRSNEPCVHYIELPKCSEPSVRFNERTETDSLASPLRRAALQQPAVGEPQPTNVINVRPVTDWTDVLTHGVSTMTEALLAASFIPFLAYFLLTWKHHARSATVMLFPLEHRHTAYVTLGLIGKMLQSFIVGNLLIGLLISAISVVIFWLLGVPFFYFIGFASGFLSLVPYLGLVLAMVPPILVGLGQLDASDLLAIVVVVILLHLFALNVLYPKMLGSRLKLNPLAVTIALLFWGWIWGAIGLVLAIPITGALKIIFDHVESMKAFAAWLGE